jgi:transposase
MKTLTLEFREQILAAYDQEQASREEIARRFGVSLGMVKKLLQQRRRTGDIRPRHRFSGRKPKILSRHRQQLRKLLALQPDLTLIELRSAMGLSCSLSAIHHALAAMNLTYGKRHSKISEENARN